MNTTITLFQLASILGVSMQAAQRLVRQRKLRVHHVAANKVKHFDVTAVMALIKS